jgi:hypothetical protein
LGGLVTGQPENTKANCNGMLTSFLFGQNGHTQSLPAPSPR